MKKSTLVKTAALAAAGIAGWYLTGNSRKGQVEGVRREVYRLLSVRRDELNALGIHIKDTKDGTEWTL